jgi:hypothetical protein
MSFVTNHDTDRNAGEYLGHKDGTTFILANEWLLASGYGSPQVFSSFEWVTSNDSPPANANGIITDTDCSSDAWTCDHRDRGIVATVKWHNYVGNARRTNWYTDDANVIAFSKDSRGWAAFNNGTGAKQIHVQTGLPRGTYCATPSTTRTQEMAARSRQLSWTTPGSLPSLLVPRMRSRSPAPTESNHHTRNAQNAGGCPPAFVAADEALGYAVRMRARAARRFNARRSSSLRPPQTP